MSATHEHAFLTSFTTTFPLSQTCSWHLFQHAPKLVSMVCLELQGALLTMALWRRPTTKGSVIGKLGETTASNINWTPFSSKRQQPPPSMHCKPLLSSSVGGMPVKVTRL